MSFTNKNYQLTLTLKLSTINSYKSVQIHSHTQIKQTQQTFENMHMHKQNNLM